MPRNAAPAVRCHSDRTISLPPAAHRTTARSAERARCTGRRRTSCYRQALSCAILASVNQLGSRAAHLGDFTLRPRSLMITGVALLIGGASAVAAFCLLRLIGLITNAVFY